MRKTFDSVVETDGLTDQPRARDARVVMSYHDLQDHRIRQT